MKSSNIPVTDDGRSYLKMKAIREGTGCPASTIQYYQNLGLLQETIKTGPNMAYYHPETIERVHYIRLLQSRYRLPISRIKELVENNTMDDKVKVVSYLNDLIFGPESDNLITLQQFSKLTGLDETLIDKLVDMGLLVPVQDDLYDSQDIMIGVIMKKCMAYDLKAEDIEFYAESAKALVENEMAIRNRLSDNLSLEDNSAVTQELTQMARTFRSYIFDRTFQKKILTSIEIEK